MKQQGWSVSRGAWPLGLLLCLAPPLGAGELRLDARALFEKSVGRHLRLSADGTAVELERGELFEDDGPAAGYSYKPNEERLSATTWVKKELLIPNPQARKATLLVGPGGDLRARVNGKAVGLKGAGKVGGYWQAYTFPADALKPGKNEFVLSGSGKVWIARDDEFAAGSATRTRHPDRSAKSTDGGKTWDYKRLGAGGATDGEYYVRVFLDHHRPRGTLTLPVVDAGNLDGGVVAPPVASVGPVRVAVEATVGKAGGVTVRARSGPTPVPGAKGWSGWQALGARGGVLRDPAGRYVQVALELTTSDPLHSPQLQRVVLRASPKASGAWAKGVRVLAAQNEEIVRTSIPFEYEPFDHPDLKALRAKYKLDEVARGAKGDLDLMARLAGWSARQWERGHLKEAYPPWSALEVLKPHADGRPVGGFCLQRNLVFLQACESFGLPGRVVSIGPGDHGAKIRGGHEVVEVWSNEHRQWVYVDGDAGWYFVDGATKAPLSLWELRRRQARAVRGQTAEPVRVVNVAKERRAWKGMDGWPPFLELRLVPRSNFLQKKAPLPLNQGMRGWFWTGHHVWTDEDHPASLLYGHAVGRRGDWEWTLNQARYTLEATDTPGELRVHLDTETPDFEAFLAEVDGGGKRPVASGFLWKLRRGKNTLEVRPRNKLGREGIASRVVLLYR